MPYHAKRNMVEAEREGDQPMARWTVSTQPRMISRLSAITAVASMLTVVAGSTVSAQTLTNPNPQTKWPPPHAVAKSPPSGRVKSCAAYGAGFVNVAGTDACVKIGGFVSTEAGGQGR